MGSRSRAMTAGSTSYMEDGPDYDARKTAYRKFMANPTKYSEERHHESVGIGDYDDGGSRFRDTGPVSVVVEHSSGSCIGQSVCDDLRESIKLNFPEVKFREIQGGRHGSFEVFLNGKLLYSKLVQGGYPYEDEVLEAIEDVKQGMQVHKLQRGSYTCTIL